MHIRHIIKVKYNDKVRILDNFSHSSNNTKELGCKKLVRISKSPPSLKGTASTDETEHISMRPEDMLGRGLKTYSTSMSKHTVQV